MDGAILPAGAYGINRGTAELGIHTVDASGRLDLSLAPGQVATVYPTHGENQAPHATDWGASPSLLHQPVSSTTLRAVAADPEGEQIKYHWTVKQQPAGASVRIAQPDSPTTAVTGLDVVGEYAFSVTITDGKSTVTQDLVPARVVAGNLPPVFFEMATRKSIYLQVPGITRTTLAYSAYDPENEPIKIRCSIVSQPAGADAVVKEPGPRRCDVADMKVAGDYRFRVEADDGHQVTAEELTVTVHPANHSPEITAMTATPAKVEASSGKTLLVATTTDGDGDNLGCWWNVRSSPVGSHPVFARRGYHETEVSGLTVPGDYVFEMVAADNTERAFSSTTVKVLAAGK
ncbi:MAG: hypothetical protein PSU94_17645 [Lacunisphaera sp.]|nr:hypothetical protein [Lacunisphaera sp.]